MNRTEENRRTENGTDRTSLAMLTASMVIYGTIGIFRRSIPLSSGVLACVRGLLGAAFLCLFILVRGGRIRHGMARADFFRFVLSGAMIGVNWILLFEAYNYTSVAVATLCYYMQPVIVILVSPFYLKERLTARKLLLAAAAVLGMVLVTGLPGAPAAGGQAAAGQLRGVLCGLGAAALYAAVIMVNKKGGPADPWERTIIQLFSAAVVLIPYLALTEDFSAIRLSGTDVALVLILGIVHTGIAYALYFGSMGGLRAQTIALFSYIDPVVALILSAAVLGERLTAAGLAGAVLILGAAVFSEA